MTRVARCCCGAVAVTVEGDPALQGICHCKNCKRRTGTAFGWSSYFKASQVIGTTGETKCYRIDGPHRQERFFCATCGTTLHWRTSAFEGLVGIAGGCFVEDPLPEPKVTVSNQGLCAWLTLPEDWRESLSRAE